ncbi:related to peptidyl-prolyl cis-trans isomerase [Ustilago trichophora]|uniref:Related to peptidyl-prolyl cis-trans isomerase n=1 Tax=Ustilago trichophora TaxID=86804 RepID=A0A5C3ER09_9BASI|nr:related to peptidyl-prolyl cis-trans isomerase [Ustilago trichophora]
MAVIEPVAVNSRDAASVGSQPSGSTSKSGMTIDEQLIKAEELKSSGNQAFEKGELTEALNNWHHSLLYCAGINSFASLYGARSTDAENERAACIASAVYNNMAACYLRQSKWEKAVYAASKTLALAPKNLKALYRRAEAYLELGRNQLAAKDIDIALDLRPEDAVIRKLGERLVQAFEDEEMARQQDRGAKSST